MTSPQKCEPREREDLLHLMHRARGARHLLRGAAQGTVRAQLTRIYAKAGVSGRAQFGAWFVEDLLDEGLRAAE